MTSIGLVFLALQAAQPVVVVSESSFDRLVRETREYTRAVDEANARKRAETSRHHSARRTSKATGPVSNKSVHASSLADEIEKLAALRQRGLLSAAEFNAAKAKLLKR